MDLNKEKTQAYVVTKSAFSASTLVLSGAVMYNHIQIHRSIRIWRVSFDSHYRSKCFFIHDRIIVPYHLRFATRRVYDGRTVQSFSQEAPVPLGGTAYRADIFCRYSFANGGLPPFMVFGWYNKTDLYRYGGISLVQYGHKFYLQKQKRKMCNDTAFCNFRRMFLDDRAMNTDMISYFEAAP